MKFNTQTVASMLVSSLLNPAHKKSSQSQIFLTLKKPNCVIHIFFLSTQSLPKSTAIITSIPPEFFGDAVMILEFLNAFGPLFDIKEIIRESITFGKLFLLSVYNDMP